MIAWQWQHPTAQTVLLTACVILTPFYVWFVLKRYRLWSQERWKPPVLEAILLWIVTGGVAYRAFPSFLGVAIPPELASLILPLAFVAVSLLWHGVSRFLSSKRGRGI